MIAALANGTPRNVAIVIAIVIVHRAGSSTSSSTCAGRKPEVGSEIELGAEPQARTSTTRCSRARASSACSRRAWCSLVVIAIGLPLYWILEPGRQAGAIAGLREALREWGAELFAPTAEGGFNCAGCHGGMKAIGGVAPYTITDPAPARSGRSAGRRRRSTPCCTASARTRSRYILTYGRPFSPMSPWGLAGGGPMNDQQIRHADRLHRRCDPDPARRSTEAAGNAVHDGHLPAPRTRGRSTAPNWRPRGHGKYATSARRCSTSAVERRLLVRPLPHHGLELRRPAGRAGRRRHGAEPHRRSEPPRSSRSRADQIDVRPRRAPTPGKKLRPAGSGPGRMPGFGHAAHRRADRGHRRVRAESVMACGHGSRCISLGSPSSAASSSVHHRASWCCAAAST